jgi:hypothetical protein
MVSRVWLNYTTIYFVIMENSNHGNKCVTQSQTYKLISFVYYKQKDFIFCRGQLIVL